MTEIKLAKPKDGRLSETLPGGAVTSGGCGGSADAGRGWRLPALLRAGSALRLLPLTREKRKANVRFSCALCESRVAPAGKGETAPAGAARRGRVLFHCCPAGEVAEEPSAKRGHSRAVF